LFVCLVNIFISLLYMASARSLRSNHVPNCRCGRLYFDLRFSVDLALNLICIHSLTVGRSALYRVWILILGTIKTQELFVHGNHLYMGTICTWEPYVHRNHLYIGTICTWEPFVHRNHLYLATLCTWEPFVHRNNLFLGIFLMGTKFIQESYCIGRSVFSGTIWVRNFIARSLFSGTLFSGTFCWERFGRNVLSGALCAWASINRQLNIKLLSSYMT
jgi:hypothetical protein